MTTRQTLDVREAEIAAMARSLITSYEDRGNGYDKTLAVLRYAAALDSRAGDAGEALRPMAEAPKDGTMVRLLVDYSDGGGALEDDHPRSWTIGFNSFEDTGEDEWKFAGWCWSHDHFTQGSGKPVGWLPWSNPSAGGDDR